MSLPDLPVTGMILLGQCIADMLRSGEIVSSVLDEVVARQAEECAVSSSSLLYSRARGEGSKPLTILWAAGLVVLAYLAGSIPTGYWMGLTKGIDIRTVGSGSTGATNVLRSVGRKEAFVVFIADIAKGYLPIWWAMTLEAPRWSSLGLPPYTIPVVVALMPVIGHSRSVFLGFTGGKSAATGLGTCLALNPLAAGIAFSIWLVVLAASKIVSLASITASALTPIVFYFCGSPPMIVGFSVVGALYVIVRHRSNLKRLMNGTEPRIGKKTEGVDFPAGAAK